MFNKVKFVLNKMMQNYNKNRDNFKGKMIKRVNKFSDNINTNYDKNSKKYKEQNKNNYNYNQKRNFCSQNYNSSPPPNNPFDYSIMIAGALVGSYFIYKR